MYPRLLVVTSNNFNLLSGGGVTLTNLFRGWPVDRIANLHEDPTPPDTSVCATYYRLSDREVSPSWPFSALGTMTAMARRHRRPTGAPARPGAGDRPPPSALAGRSGVTGRLSRAVFGDGLPRSVRLSAGLGAWLREVRPQLVYGFLGSMAQIRLVRLLQETLAVPVVVHVMDDWPSVIYREGLLGPALRRVVLREFGDVLARAAARLAISDAMAEEYHQRYGYRFLPFHNALDVEAWLPTGRRTWEAQQPFVVRYVGSLVADGQRDGMQDVCRAVGRLAAGGAPVELWIHGPPDQSTYLSALELPPGVLRLAGPAGQDDVPRLLAGADLLVLPFNFDARSARYIRLSMPTKIPAYMISGTPTLVYGPPDVAAVRYAAGAGWGHTVTERGVEPLAAAIHRLMHDQGRRRELGERARALAVANHDAARVRPAFHRALIAAVDGAGMPDAAPREVVAPC